MMLLPALLLSVGPYLVGGAYWLSTMGGILLVATGAAWWWPLPGGRIALGASALPLGVAIGLILTNYEILTMYGVVFLAFSLIYLGGSIMLLRLKRQGAN